MQAPETRVRFEFRVWDPEEERYRTLRVVGTKGDALELEDVETGKILLSTSLAMRPGWMDRALVWSSPQPIPPEHLPTVLAKLRYDPDTGAYTYAKVSPATRRRTVRVNIYPPEE